MTAEPSAAPINVFADLRIDVDGQMTTLTGDGRRLTFTTESPQHLLNALPDTRREGLRIAGRMAELLGSQGLQLRVVGPHGDIALIGHDARSRWGRAVIGSSMIQAGSVRSLGSLVLSIARGSRLFWPGVGLAGAVVASVVVRKGATVISDRHERR